MEELFQQALALQTAGRLEEAEAIYRRLGGYRPDWALANLGVICRTTGRLAEAEAPLREALAADSGNLVTQHLPGRRILVNAGQGLSVQIQLARFLPLPEPAEVFYAGPRPLVRLLAPRVGEIGNGGDGVRADCGTRIGLVPRWLGVGPADAPAP